MSNKIDQLIAKQMLQDALIDINLDKYNHEENPKLVLLGGQPASGKSSVIDEVVKEYKQNKQDIVVLNSDDYKEHYPKYSKIVSKDPNKIVEIHPYSNYVLGEVLKQTAPKGINALLEGTMRSAGYPLQVIDGFKSCGYQIDAYFIATNNYSSTVGHIERFENEIANRGFGRAVPQSHHDDAYNNIPNTIAKLAESGKLANIIIVDREFNKLAQIINGDDVVKSYLTNREKITPELFNDISKRIDNTIQMKDNRNAPVEEINYLQGIKDSLTKDFRLQQSQGIDLQADKDKTVHISNKDKVADVLNAFEKHNPKLINKIRVEAKITDPKHFITLDNEKPRELAKYLAKECKVNLQLEKKIKLDIKPQKTIKMK